MAELIKRKLNIVDIILKSITLKDNQIAKAKKSYTAVGLISRNRTDDNSN